MTPATETTRGRHDRMRAVVARSFGPPEVLRLEEVERPVPGDDEVLIRVRATTVTAGDCELRGMRLPGHLRLPLRLYVGLRNRDGTILGQELAGEVESVGDRVTRFSPGDRVFAATLFRFGAYAEYVSLPQTYPIARVPDGVTFEDAATVPVGGVNGLHFLRQANVRAGDSVLVNGAGGSIGTYAIQIAKSIGADVTAVDRGEKLDVLRSIGADRVVDYTREDFAEGDGHYDAIVDVIGGRASKRALERLAPNGRYVLGNPSLRGMVSALWTSLTTDTRVRFQPASPRAGDMASLAELVAAGDVTPVLDRRYPLEGIVDAHRYVESGRKTGNVVVEL